MKSREKHINTTRGIWLFTALFSIFIFVLNYLFPLMPGDDFLYSLKIPEDHYIGQKPITSFTEYLESQVNHFNNYNYRIVPHAILQVVLLFPSWVFDFINTIAFLAIPLCLLRPFKIEKESKSGLYLLVLLFIWVFHFDLGRAYFWTSGSLNYSWMLLPQLYLAGSLFEYVKKGQTNFGVLDYVCVLLIGFSNENVVLSFFCVILLIVLDQIITGKKPERSLIVFAGILLAGGVIMLSSPALTLRISKEGYNYDSVDEKILEYGKRTMFYLICYSSVLLFFLFSNKSKVRVKRPQILLLLIMLFSTGSMFIAPLFEPRSAVFGFMICIMLVLSMIRLESYSRFWLTVLVVASSYLFFNRYPIFREVNVRYNINKTILEANWGSKDTVYLERYCTSSKYQCLICDDISDDPQYMDNEPLAAYYDIHKVSLKPEYALFSKWKGFKENISEYVTNNTASVDVGVKLTDKIDLKKVYFKKYQKGMDIISELNTNSVSDDYILILRGSRKGINWYRLLDILPINIRLYFLDYLEYQGKMINQEQRGYYFNHVFDEGNYSYYIVSLYSMNNHRPVGTPVKIKVPL